MREICRASERRRFTRVPFDTHARLTQAGSEKSSAVILLDLCLQGALIELLEFDAFSSEKIVLTCGEITQLELLLDDRETVISMEAEVVHIQGRHIGLRCRVVDLDSITHLRRLVELNLGDPELFQREIALLGQPFSEIYPLPI